MPEEPEGDSVESAPRVRDPEKKRANILRAAAKLFAEKGVEGTTIRDIANRSGENMGLIYYYFKDKEDLFNAVVVDTVLGSLGRVMTEEANTRGDASERLTRVVMAYVDMIENDPDRAMLAMRGLLKLVEGQKNPFIGLMTGRLEAIESIVREGVDSGEFVGVDMALFAFFFMAIAFGYFAANLAARSYPEEGFEHYESADIKKLFEGVVLRGLRTDQGKR